MYIYIYIYIYIYKIGLSLIVDFDLLKWIIKKQLPYFSSTIMILSS
jgi:sialic acid synthase SpsE